MTTATSKLRKAHALGPDRVEERDGREFHVFVLAEASRDDVRHKPNPIDTALAHAELDARHLMVAPHEDDNLRRRNATTDSGNDIDYIRNPFVHVITTSGGGRGGLVAHRGVLQDGEYVDPDVLREAVEQELGHTYEQVRSVYRQGPLSSEQREIRDVIDARMLALRRSGANLTELGRAIGLPIKYDGHCRTLDNAVQRARAIEQWRAALS